VPVFLKSTWLNDHWRGISIILNHFRLVFAIPSKVKSSLKVCLFLCPAISDSFPKVFIDIEKCQKSVIIDNCINCFEGHVVQLESGFHHLSFSFLRDDYFSFFIPVNIPFAFTPLNSIFFTNLLHFELRNSGIYSLIVRRKNDPAHIWCNESRLFVVLISKFPVIAWENNNHNYNEDKHGTITNKTGNFFALFLLIMFLLFFPVSKFFLDE